MMLCVAGAIATARNTAETARADIAAKNLLAVLLMLVMVFSLSVVASGVPDLGFGRVM